MWNWESHSREIFAILFKNFIKFLTKITLLHVLWKNWWIHLVGIHQPTILVRPTLNKVLIADNGTHDIFLFFVPWNICIFLFLTLDFSWRYKYGLYGERHMSPTPPHSSGVTDIMKYVSSHIKMMHMSDPKFLIWWSWNIT